MGREDGAAAARDALELESELAEHGLRLRLHQRGAQLLTAGVTARVALGSLAANAASRAAGGQPGKPDRGLSVVYAALRAGLPVTVTIIDPAGQASDASLEEFRRRFCGFLDAAAVDRDLLGLCLSASELPSAEFRSSIRPNLGDGPRYVMLHEKTGITVATGRATQRSGDCCEPRSGAHRASGPCFPPVCAASVRCSAAKAQAGYCRVPGLLRRSVLRGCLSSWTSVTLLTPGE